MLNTIQGKFTLLEKITIEDAGVICDLRNNNNKFLSSQEEISLDSQIKWLKENLNNSDCHYFKIIDKKNKLIVGTISLYEICNNQAEFGRYICNQTLQAIEAELLIIDFAFQVLKLQIVYCRTKIDNIKVWKQHYNLGFEDWNSSEHSHDYKFFKIQYMSQSRYNVYAFDKVKNILNKFDK